MDQDNKNNTEKNVNSSEHIQQIKKIQNQIENDFKKLNKSQKTLEKCNLIKEKMSSLDKKSNFIIGFNIGVLFSLIGFLVFKDNNINHQLFLMVLLMCGIIALVIEYFDIKKIRKEIETLKKEWEDENI